MRVFGGFDSLSQTAGGVAKVARLTAKVLTDPASGLQCKFAAATYLDHHAAGWDFPVLSAGGSRVRFAAAVAAAAWRYDLFVYNFLGLARSHGMLPLQRRPFVSFVAGIEAWPGYPGDSTRAAAARRATALFAISNHTRRRAIELDPTFARSQVCWLGTEEDEPTLPPASAPPPRVLIVGRMGEGYKGHAELIDCWPRVVAVVPNAVLTIAGGGSLADEYRRRAAASPAAGRIEFRGFVPEGDMPRLWAETAVFAMPSRGEGFGLVYVEAMRHGVPVVASVHDAGAEVNADGVSGYNVDLDQPNELPDRLARLLADPVHATALGAAGRQRWDEQFRYSAFRSRFATLMAPLIHAPTLASRSPA